MSNTIIFVKLNSSAEEIIRYMEESYEKAEPRYYNLSSKDDAEVEDMSEADRFYFVGLLYNCAKEDKPKVVEAYLGTGSKCRNERGYSIQYKMKAKLPSNLALKNICKLTELDLTSDFELTNYLLRVNSDMVAEQLDMIISAPKSYATESRNYEKIDSEDSLHSLAQRNEYCRAFCAASAA